MDEALECARAWCAYQSSPRCPNELAHLLASHPNTNGAIIARAEPECRIHFDKLSGEPRNADIVAIAIITWLRCWRTLPTNSSL
jgi:hypothetical protein